MVRKKICAFLLLVVALCISGCGGAEVPETTAAAEPETLQESMEEETEEVTEAEVPRVTETASPAYDSSFLIPETLLYEDPDLKILAEELSYEESQVLLRLSFQNTGEVRRTLSMHAGSVPLLSVNDRYVEGFLEPVRLDPGSTVKTQIIFPYENLLTLGILQISSIRFCLTDQDFSTGILTLSTEAPMESFGDLISDSPESLCKEVLFRDETIGFDKAGVRHVGSWILKKEDGRNALYLDFANTSGKTKILSAGALSVNGLQLLQQDAVLTLLPGSHGILTVDLTETWEKNHLNALGISEIHTLDLDLSIYKENLLPDGMPGAMHLSFTQDKTPFDGSGTLISQENEIQIRYAGTFLKADGSIDLILLCENKTFMPFFAQVSSLHQGEQEIPVERTNVTLSGNGWGIFCIPVIGDAAENLDSAGTFTLTTLQKIGKERKILTLQLVSP